MHTDECAIDSQVRFKRRTTYMCALPHNVFASRRRSLSSHVRNGNEDGCERGDAILGSHMLRRRGLEQQSSSMSIHENGLERRGATNGGRAGVVRAHSSKGAGGKGTKERDIRDEDIPSSLPSLFTRHYAVSPRSPLGAAWAVLVVGEASEGWYYPRRWRGYIETHMRAVLLRWAPGLNVRNTRVIVCEHG